MATDFDRPSGVGFEPDFHEHRITTLVSVNLHTYWSIAIILLAFAAWDYYVDPANWRSALTVRIIGSLIVVATGVFQTLPGKARSLPLMAKVRLVAAAVTSVVAASMLDRGYGFGVAGLVVIILTGPYVAIDSRDLLKSNLAGLLATIVTLTVRPVDPFLIVGTMVFVALAMVVSTLLGRVLEASYRRAFALEQELHRDARTDALTGLDNRRSIQEIGRTAVKLSRRTGAPISLVLCDFDRFKDINDKYGHEAGDSVLMQTAAILRNQLRDSDVVGRWGGEEFVVLMPATHAEGAVGVAERLRTAIAETRFEQVAERQTISLGVATSQKIDDPDFEWDLLLKEADQRLYRAKREGRNRVVGG